RDKKKSVKKKEKKRKRQETFGVFGLRAVLKIARRRGKSKFVLSSVFALVGSFSHFETGKDLKPSRQKY
ncbi:hypothetical protein PoB_006751500, partial [Plakobranchus ocellatus]